jgi:hypothetical protein
LDVLKEDVPRLLKGVEHDKTLTALLLGQLYA